MYPLHPAMADAVNRAHITELRRWPTTPPVTQGFRHRTAAARETMGWFLVNVGLRVAVRPVPAAQAAR
jgi:hypothetical protein